MNQSARIRNNFDLYIPRSGPSNLEADRIQCHIQLVFRDFTRNEDSASKMLRLGEKKRNQIPKVN
jgi:hypothetical protein